MFVAFLGLSRILSAMKRLLLVLILTACSADIMGLGEAVPYDSPMLRPLWNEVEACSGLQGNFDAVRWYLAPNGIKRNGVWVGGLWDQDENKIYLTPPHKDDPRMIKHEEMHALLGPTGNNHPPHYFNGVCGDLGV